jgi:hypothetical protein
MIRGLLVALARIFLWVVVFVLLTRVLRIFAAPFLKRRDSVPPPNPPDSQKKIDYDDVKDASFTDLK